MKKKELISIIIVNWNGKKWLSRCLNSLHRQSYKNFEIIFVDNNSSDNSISFVKKKYPKIKIIKNKKNFGFAEGNNIGFKKSKGQFILLLNNDTYVQKDFLIKFIEAFRVIPNLASAQSKIILMNNHKKLDMVGAYWTDFSFLYYYGFGKNSNYERYNKPMPFFSNKGASMMIKRKVIEEIGLFDGDFFNYYEETDFCHRAWLSGYQCWYWPKAICYHALGGTSSKFDNSLVQYHNFKNKLKSFLKNFEIKSLIKIVPVYIFLCIILSIVYLIKGKYRHAFAIYFGILWNIKNIKKTLVQRIYTQKFRKKTDNDILGITKKNPNLIYYYLLIKGSVKDFKDKTYKDEIL